MIDTHQAIMKEAGYPSDDTNNRERDSEVLTTIKWVRREAFAPCSDWPEVGSSPVWAGQSWRFRTLDSKNSHFSSCLYPVQHRIRRISGSQRKHAPILASSTSSSSMKTAGAFSPFSSELDMAIRSTEDEVNYCHPGSRRLWIQRPCLIGECRDKPNEVDQLISFLVNLAVKWFLPISVLVLKCR